MVRTCTEEIRWVYRECQSVATREQEKESTRYEIILYGSCGTGYVGGARHGRRCREPSQMRMYGPLCCPLKEIGGSMQYVFSYDKGGGSGSNPTNEKRK